MSISFRVLPDFYEFGMLIVLSGVAAIRRPGVAVAIGMWLYSFPYTIKLG